MVCRFGPQLERERLDLRSQVSVLKDGRVAIEEELKARSTALVHTAEETAQQRAESSALRYCLSVSVCLSLCGCDVIYVM